jgi:cytochrome c-type biogenesis protein CcmH
MIGFMLAASALTLLTVALLVVPLLRRRAARPGATQAEASVAVLREQLEELERDRATGTIDAAGYESAAHSLKRRILEDSAPETAIRDRRHLVPAIALAVALPLAVGGLYAWLGAPQLIGSQASPEAAQREHDSAQLSVLVDRLARRLESTPDDLEGWTMLARSYRALGRHAEAAAAYARAEKAIGSDAVRLTEWAESLALSSGGALAGKPAELVARALAIDPENAHALALAGAAAFERKDWNGAVRYWERLAKQFAPGSPPAETVQRSLAAAREELARAGGTPAAPEAAPAPPAAMARAPAANGVRFRLAGKVSLAPALAAKAAPDDTVFIFARAVTGPPRPLAVVRRQVKELPVNFTLDESNAMLAQTDLASIGEVVVGARVSHSGTALPRSGDLEGLSRPVKIGASGIDILIDRALP